MSEPERVAMMWPAELKQRVRSLVGGRGLSAFVIAAVEAKLDAMPTSTTAEPASSEPDKPESAKITERILAARADRDQDEDQADVDDRSCGEAAVVDVVPAQFDQSTKTQRTEQIQDAFGLQRASQLEPPTTPAESAAPTVEPAEPEKEDAPTFCSSCHAPLIAGECWTCSM